MHALVLGIPLPHINFDNYSFLSAPSLFDYDQIIVDMSALSEAVEQARDGSPEHNTHSGQTVVNGPSSTKTFSLAELLRLRRLEAERALARGGTVVCLAYPDVAHEGIAGLPGWRRYDWLPAPEGFSYTEHLLAGFGKPGVEIADAEHAFAPYVDKFGGRLAFRAYASEQDESFSQCGRVFARSPGGAAVGVELKVGPGRVVLLPPLDSLDYSKDRVPLANVLCNCLERMQAGTADEPSQLIDKEAS
ncbi:MAG: hypothetical protein IIA91_02645 [Chloroflexi bacterium]|nr:hypothetical protein [Chloroflexota bacterium]